MLKHLQVNSFLIYSIESIVRFELSILCYFIISESVAWPWFSLQPWKFEVSGKFSS